MFLRPLTIILTIITILTFGSEAPLWAQEVPDVPDGGGFSKPPKEKAIILPTKLSLPPRTITDITTLLSQSIKRDAASVRKLEKKVSREPSGDGSIRFYADRGEAFIKLGRTTEGIEDLEKARARAMASSMVSEPMKVFLLRSLALQQLYGGDMFEGIANLTRAMAFESKRCNERSNLNICHQTVMAASLLSTSYSFLRNVEEAEKWLNYARSRKEQLDHWNTHHKGFNWRGGSVSNAKGRFSIMKGEFADAEKFYIEAVEHLRKIPGDWSLGPYLRELADAQILMGKYREAELTIREALAILIKEMGANSPLTALGLVVLSKILNEQGRSKDAESLARTAMSIYEKGNTLKSSMAYGKAQEILVTTLIVQNKYQEAYTLSQNQYKAISAIPGAVESTVVATNIHSAVAALMVGDLDKAEIPLTKRLKHFEKLYGDDHYQTAEALALLSIIRSRRGALEEAELGFRKALPIISGAANEEAYSLKSYKHRQQIILEGYFELVVKRETKLDATKRTSLLAESVSAVQSVHHTSVQKALLSNAARTSSRNPELASALRETQDLDWKINGQYSIIAALAQSGSTSETQTKIDKARKAVSLLKDKKSAMENQLLKEFPEYRNFIRPQALADADIREVLREGEVLIIFYVGDRGTYVWAIPKTGSIRFLRAKMGREDLEDIIAELRSAVDPGPIDAFEDIPEFDVAEAYWLYEQLLKPVLEGGMDSSKLLFVGHGPLSQLPLSLLPTNPTALKEDTDLLFKNYAEVPWLAKTHAVTMIPSVTALKALRGIADETTERRALVGFGDPYFNKSQALEADKNLAVQLADATSIRSMPVTMRNRPQTREVDSANLGLLPRLPDTRDELHSIAESMGADPKHSLYLGRKANEKQFKEMKLDDIRVIVFATHGLIPGDLDGLDQPALALSAPDIAGVGGDGLLTMDEIIGLRINADWVVLSACNTASGDGAGAEAVSGLGRAFFYAGAKSLLVSNWPVHSEATAYLTSILFSLQATNASLGRAEALQQTRLKMINQGTLKDELGEPIFSYAHPIFWAPFTIVGDGE
jgi:CHAT domain-containing protein/tetratricopeptide (TPR) repeat protein